MGTPMAWAGAPSVALSRTHLPRPSPIWLVSPTKIGRPNVSSRWCQHHCWADAARQCGGNPLPDVLGALSPHTAFTAVDRQSVESAAALRQQSFSETVHPHPSLPIGATPINNGAITSATPHLGSMIDGGGVTGTPARAISRRPRG